MKENLPQKQFPNIAVLTGVSTPISRRKQTINHFTRSIVLRRLSAVCRTTSNHVFFVDGEIVKNERKRRQKVTAIYDIYHS